ncbi:MAG: matrixin family metalloprotease [Myxococcota bacterium]
MLGEFPGELTASVTTGLQRELQVDVETIDGVPLPESAYYPRRRRYRADRLLDFLNEHLEGAPESTRVLGLTSVDISTTKPPYEDWGVFGLGELGGRSCVISTYRLHRSARNAEHLDFRVTTTAIHEVGHTLGLEHCSEPTCIMRDAEGSIRTVDTSSGIIEPECRRELDEESPPVLEYQHLAPLEEATAPE